MTTHQPGLCHYLLQIYLSNTLARLHKVTDKSTKMPIILPDTCHYQNYHHQSSDITVSNNWPCQKFHYRQQRIWTRDYHTYSTVFLTTRVYELVDCPIFNQNWYISQRDVSLNFVLFRSKHEFLYVCHGIMDAIDKTAN